MVRLLFFGINTTRRQQIVDELKHLLVPPTGLVTTPLSKIQGDDDLTHLAIRQRSSSSSPALACTGTTITAPLCSIAQRPLSSLLMRDPEHYMVNDAQIEEQQVQMNMWYGNATLWVTGEYIVRNYLYHNTIHWDLQDHGMRDTTLTPLLSLAYNFMCRVRMEQVSRPYTWCVWTLYLIYFLFFFFAFRGTFYCHLTRTAATFTRKSTTTILCLLSSITFGTTL